MLPVSFDWSVPQSHSDLNTICHLYLYIFIATLCILQFLFHSYSLSVLQKFIKILYSLKMTFFCFVIRYFKQFCFSSKDLELRWKWLCELNPVYFNSFAMIIIILQSKTMNKNIVIIYTIKVYCILWKYIYIVDQKSQK